MHLSLSKNRRWTDSPYQMHPESELVKLPFSPLELAATFLKPGSGKCLTLGTLSTQTLLTFLFILNRTHLIGVGLRFLACILIFLVFTSTCLLLDYKFNWWLRCKERADDRTSMVPVAHGEASQRWRVSRVGGPAGAGASNLEDIPSSWRKPPTRPPLAGPYAFSRIPRPVWTHPRVFLTHQPGPTWLFENVVAGYEPSTTHQPNSSTAFAFPHSLHYVLNTFCFCL